MSERTLVLIKPDSVQKKCIGKILSRFEEGGLTLVAMKLDTFTEERAQEFYREHLDKAFFHDLVAFMTEGPMVVCVFEGDSAVALGRELIGETDPKRSPKGTIRADFGESIDRNAVHGSDSVPSARREIACFQFT
ncbi:nucleoside-diphosphate kinase [Candidatus Similichlamydia laticola]|uniref:Nucleoside diphosphate kinase n=1 Tax=Candidatus Similichlamydia laticola TaxID=2170265 RepID=A0A369KCT4_9BACT|nr:nucleoside-diphosphate kinase [Candidatus Similichlamydia laticola]RDB31718.1 Nucleoside diphosphate kinase [Candidatus Similichlamydia laticola]